MPLDLSTSTTPSSSLHRQALTSDLHMQTSHPPVTCQQQMVLSVIWLEGKKKVDHPTGCWMNDNGTIRILRSNVLYTSEPMDVRWDGTACTWMEACMYPTGRFGLTILGKHPGKHATFWGFCQCVSCFFFNFLTYFCSSARHTRTTVSLQSCTAHTYLQYTMRHR